MQNQITAKLGEFTAHALADRVDIFDADGGLLDSIPMAEGSYDDLASLLAEWVELGEEEGGLSEAEVNALNRAFTNLITRKGIAQADYDEATRLYLASDLAGLQTMARRMDEWQL